MTSPPPVTHATSTAAATAIDAVARRAYGRLLAMLVASRGNIADAEDALGEALLRALASWPQHGLPDNPDAWLLTTARNLATDNHRRRRRAAVALRSLAAAAAQHTAPPPTSDALDDHPIRDDILRVLFLAAHPALPPALHAPLMLQCVLGLDAATIASAFLVAPSAMAQRLVRAKLALRQASASLDMPPAHLARQHLPAVLDALYAAFLAGWELTAAAARPDGLSAEAIRLTSALVAAFPDHPEAHGALALMLMCEARRDARRDAAGRFVPFDQQDPARWDLAMIARAEHTLLTAAAHHAPGRFQLEAAIQSAHIHGRRSGATDWPAILSLYTALLAIAPSLGAAVAHAAALLRARGPLPAQQALDALASSHPALTAYQPYWVTRAHIARALGNLPAAHHARDLAIGLTDDPAIRDHLLTTT